MRTLYIAALLLVFQSTQAQDSLRTFIFGHSLILHEHIINPIPTQENATPHWLHFLAKEANKSFEVDGKYGFIPSHARDEIFAQWGFDSVPQLWDSDFEPFSAANFNSILITPANFIQWIGPNDNYWNETQSLVDFTEDLFERVDGLQPNLNFYMYENWPDMASYMNTFPPTPNEWSNYNDYVNGEFHDWNIEYHDSVADRFPGRNVKMIPVGPAISRVLQSPPFDQINIDSLYEDDAPHGRPSIYYLAALITYMAMYQEKAPSSYIPPNSIQANGQSYYMIDQIIIDNRQAAIDTIWNVLQEFNFPNGDSRVFIDQGIITSINIESKNQHLIISPNPVSDKLSIAIADKVAEVILFDLKGTEVHSSNSLSIDVSQIQSGLYIIQVQTENGQILRERISVTNRP